MDTAKKSGFYVRLFLVVITVIGMTGCFTASNYRAFGIAYLKQGRYDEAIENLKTAVESEPNNGDNQFWLGKAYFKKGRYEDAIRHLKKAVELQPNDRYNLDWLGKAYLRNGQCKESIQAYRKAIKIEPREALYFNQISYCQNELGNYDETITAAKRAIELDPDNDVAYHNLGFAYGEKKQYAEAIRAYKKSLELDPEDAETHAALGYLLIEKGDYKEGVNYLKRAVGLAPDNLTYLSWLSSAYYYQGRYDDALDAADKVVSLETIVGIGARIGIVDDRPVAYSVLASGPAQRAGLKKGDIIVEVDGKSTKGWRLEEVVSRLRGGEGTKVALTIKRGEKGRPFEISVIREKLFFKETSPAFACRSLAERRLGKEAQALKDAEQAYSLNSTDNWAHLALGAARLDQGRYEEALDLLSGVKDNTEARLLEARAYAKKGDYQRAINVYASIEDEENLSPKDVPFWSERGALLGELKPYVASKRKNAARLRVEGKYREAIVELGGAIRVTDGAELEAICREITGLIAMDPGLAAVPEEARKYALRGDVLTEEGKFQEAVKEYRKAVEAAPYIARLHFNTAMVYGELKKYSQATRYMKTYLLLAPEAPNARAAKDQIYKWELMIEKGE